MTPEPAPISGPPEFVWVYGSAEYFPAVRPRPDPRAYKSPISLSHRRRAADFSIGEQHQNCPDHGHDKTDRIVFPIPSEEATDKTTDERTYDTQEDRHDHSSRIASRHQ